MVSTHKVIALFNFAAKNQVSKYEKQLRTGLFLAKIYIPIHKYTYKKLFQSFYFIGVYRKTGFNFIVYFIDQKE